MTPRRVATYSLSLRLFLLRNILQPASLMYNDFSGQIRHNMLPFVTTGLSYYCANILLAPFDGFRTTHHTLRSARHVYHVWRFIGQVYFRGLRTSRPPTTHNPPPSGVAAPTALCDPRGLFLPSLLVRLFVPGL